MKHRVVSLVTSNVVKKRRSAEEFDVNLLPLAKDLSAEMGDPRYSKPVSHPRLGVAILVKEIQSVGRISTCFIRAPQLFRFPKKPLCVADNTLFV